MNYYEFICLMIGNLFFLLCGVFVGFFAVYGTYKTFSKITLWVDIKNGCMPKRKICICEYGKYKYKVSYFPAEIVKKPNYIVSIFDLQTKQTVNNMFWNCDLKTANKRFKKICKDFNRCAPWVAEMVNSQIKRGKTDT